MKAVIAAAVLLVLITQAALSMPLRPDLAERLRQEGRIEEAREILFLEDHDLEARAAQPLPDTARILVILIDFEDMPADTIRHSIRHFEDLLFSRDFEWSLRNCYAWNSYGTLDIVGEVYGWFRVDQPLSYYADNRRGMGSYPRNTQKMIEDLFWNYP